MVLLQAIKWVSIVILVSISGAYARPMPVPGDINFPALIKNSTVICRGRVLASKNPESRNVSKSETSTETLFRLDRIYKGNVPDKKIRIVAGEGNSTLSFGQNLVVGKDYILFLKHQSHGLALVSLFNTAFQNSKNKARQSKNKSSLERDLESDLLFALEHDEPEIILDSIYLLHGLKSDAARNKIRTLTKHKNDEIRGHALRFLLDLGDFSILESIIEYSNRGRSSRSADMLLTVSIEQIDNKAALNTMHVLTRSKDKFYRRSAIRSIKKIKSGKSVSLLISLLDDEDVDIRFSCVMSLVKIVGKGGKFGSSSGLFESNEESVGLWKEWWKNRSESQKQYYGTGESS